MTGLQRAFFIRTKNQESRFKIRQKTKDNTEIKSPNHQITKYFSDSCQFVGFSTLAGNLSIQGNKN